jgi:hypothetical protein
MPHPIATLQENSTLGPWVRALESRGYWARRNVLWRRIAPRLSRFLYKFRSLNHHHSLESLRDVIVGSELRLNRPTEFNDPFDMAAHFVMDASVEQRRARFTSLVKQQSSGMGWKAEQAAIQRLMSAPDEDHMARCQASLANIRASTGVYCFAGDPRSTLMWSHYASNHTGVCLQFERVRDFTVFGHAMTVKYSPDLPVVNWIIGFHESIGEMLFAKHPCWSYEAESRIIAYEQADRYLPFKAESLRGVIFGCRASDSVRATVEGMLSERATVGLPHITKYSATMHPTKYASVEF